LLLAIARPLTISQAPMQDTAKQSIPRISGADRDISLGELCSILWRSKWLILLVSACAALLALGAAQLMPVKYDAVILLSPVSSQSGSNKLGALSEVASSLGGLGSLVGLGGGGNEQKAEAIATLQSEALTESFIRDNDLLPVLYAKQWDDRTKTWRTSDPKKRPSLWKANVMFEKKIRGVTENAKTGLVTLTISWKDPAQAAAWANGLVKLTNEYLREKSIARSERNIQYLETQAAKTSEVEIRSAIFSLMQTEIKNEMVSRGNDEYALKIIDPAAVPEKPASPQPLLLSISAAIAAFVVCCLVVVVRRSP
jgi:uncharacterized protein involved in exopolysaccharide biosynthesis